MSEEKKPINWTRFKLGELTAEEQEKIVQANTKKEDNENEQAQSNHQ
jgi:hypothetical protein